jgi:hypothetical protein
MNISKNIQLLNDQLCFHNLKILTEQISLDVEQLPKVVL